MEGLVFFFLVTCGTGASTLVSREKEKEVPRVREKLKAWPWLASVWQKARHWVAREEETSSHIVALIILAYLKIR